MEVLGVSCPLKGQATRNALPLCGLKVTLPCSPRTANSPLKVSEQSGFLPCHKCAYFTIGIDKAPVFFLF